MIKRMALLCLSVLLLLSLFAGCGGDGAATPSAAPTAEGIQPTASAEPEDSPYKFAAGKVEQDERGIAQTNYTYDVPFCTSDEVLTYWTTNWTPQIIAEEGFSSMPYPQMVQEMTGVNIEWVIASANARAEQYATLLAADDLFDIMGCAYSYHPGTIPQSIDDGYYANLYEYVDYMPNYTYQIVKYDYDKDVLNKIFYDEELIACFYGMIYDPVPRMGYCIRGDFLDEVGLVAEDLDTYDEIHDALVAFKTAGLCEYPMDISESVEQDMGIFAAGLGTYMYCNGTALPSARVVDGQAVFTLTQEDDRKAMQLLNDWYAEGLINPDWASVADTTELQDRLSTNGSGYTYTQPSAVDNMVAMNDDPDCRWDFLVRPRENEGDYLKIGTKIDKFSFGNTAISADCENIPLAVSWCDWFYSEEGSFHASYGIEGLTYTYNEEGEIRLTDFVQNNPDGISQSWVLAAYGLNGLCDHGLMHNLRGSMYDGGEFQIEWLQGWTEPTGEIAYDWPISCKFTAEETETINDLSNDLVTYISENWTAFVDGSKPMSDWDAYVQGCYAVGLQELMDIYQASYARYLAS